MKACPSCHGPVWREEQKRGWLSHLGWVLLLEVGFWCCLAIFVVLASWSPWLALALAAAALGRLVYAAKARTLYCCKACNGSFKAGELRNVDASAV